jgi:hypothetical protein
MVMGDGMFNQRCHNNAVQKCKIGKAKDVYAVIYIEPYAQPIIHFINKLKNGKFQDNTLGYLHEKAKYYILRKIEPEEYGEIGDILTNYKVHLFEAHTNILERLWYKYTDVDL